MFVSVFTGPPGPRPQELIPEITNPLLVLWGDTDLLTPLNVRPHCPLVVQSAADNCDSLS